MLEFASITFRNPSHKKMKKNHSRYKHGLSKSPWYAAAKDQQARMTNHQHKAYARYGGRGLTFGDGMETVAERVAFYHEFFGPVRPEGYEIDRIDNNRGYAKDNVRLVKRKKNVNNREVSLRPNEAKRSTHNSYRKMKDGQKKWGYEICERWSGKFAYNNFLADMGEKPAGAKFRRIDKSLPYSKSNCIWA